MQVPVRKKQMSKSRGKIFTLRAEEGERFFTGR